MWSSVKTAAALFAMSLAIGTSTTGAIVPAKQSNVVAQPAKQSNVVVQPEKQPDIVVQPAKKPNVVAQPAKQPDIVVQPAKAYPGDVIFVRSKQAKSITLFNNIYKLQPVNGEYVRFIPVPFNQLPAVYQVLSTDKLQNAQLTIVAKKFATDSITVSKEMNSMHQNTARIAADQKKINAARSQSAKQAYFSDKFQMPVIGRLTTPFGYQRIVNGIPANRHTAIDIANKQGTPIVASNNGKVVLAESLYLTGNTIIIDHGLNLFSYYAHLSKLDVKTGQVVKKGQVIGKLGTTGFSTGPHLHYGMLIGNTYINPNPFFQASPYQWK